MGTQESKATSDPVTELGPLYLSEDVLLPILSFLCTRDLIHRCRLVCTQWRDLVDSPTLWRVKCQEMGYRPKSALQRPKDWQHFYYICSLQRNLLQNPCAREGFHCWQIEKNGGDQWAVEDLTIDPTPVFQDQNVAKYFVTSYSMCTKSQLIDLKDAGYGKSFMDTVQPDIVIRDWFSARVDCGCRYELLVRLLSKSKKTIKEFKPAAVIMEQWSEGLWQQMTHTFSKYGPGVRYIYFQHGGKDTQFWAGWYGVRVTNSSVTIESGDF